MNGFYQQRQRFSGGESGGSQQQQYGHGHGHGQGHHQQQQQQQQESGGTMMQLNMNGDMSTSIPGASSLDDIINQNTKSLLFRRRSMPIPRFGQQHTHYQQTPAPTHAASNEIENDMRRTSMVDMMDFGGNNTGIGTFNFDATAFDTSMLDISLHGNGGQGNMNRGSNTLSINTNAQFQAPQGGYGQQSAGYDSGMSGQNAFDVSMESPYLTSAFPQQNMGNEMSIMQADMSVPGNMFNADHFNSPMANSPMHASYIPSMLGPNLQDPAGGNDTGAVGQARTPNTNASGGTPVSNTQLQRHSSTRTNSNEKSPLSEQGILQQDNTTTQSKVRQRDVASFNPDKMAVNPKGGANPELINGNALPWSAPPNGWPSSMAGRTHMDTQFKDAYSPSGYDLMNILIKIASRPNPQINIGSVDLSCAFVVCNTLVHDSPIEYASESFERLTGYNRHEIIGQNCRFLQSPEGKVTPGIKRKYCDDDAVLYLKNCIASQAEAQISLINYRKGGQPFMNLLTMIPIINEEGVTTHFVGFQVDLVENPMAINAKNPDGSYSINYQRHESLPSYFLTAPGGQTMTEVSQTLPRDEVSTVLGAITTAGDNELSRRLMDKVLLENADDVIHVLSLKGLFLYLSPSSRKVLEYEPSELVGTPLSSVCHPSDIVPVTRELKDPSSGSSLSVVFRIRRKNSGYMWFESHGSLHTEQGKGRKCIILVGRSRPVYTLNKAALMEGGGIGENELWTKMSTTGMFLFVSSNVRQLLDRQPEEMVGTNIQQLMRPDSKEEFGRVLTIALTGKNTSVRHEMTNKRGQVLQAFSWIYPGDATEGNKPTFLVVQIRLIRHHRGGGQRGSIGGSVKGSEGRGVGAGLPQHSTGDSTPFTNTSGGTRQSIDATLYRSATGYAVTHAGAAGLSIGRQDIVLASEDNVFDELKTVRSSSWQFELRQMEKRNRLLAEEVQALIAQKKKRKRRRGAGSLQKDCANCHTKNTPEWRRGPSGARDLCNSCGLRWAKQNGRVSPRNSSHNSVKSGGAHSDKASKASASPLSDAVNAGDQPSIASITTPTSPTLGSMPPPTAAEKRTSAQEASMESHNAKVARMEAPPNAGMGLGGGIPAVIEEETGYGT